MEEEKPEVNKFVKFLILIVVILAIPILLTQVYCGKSNEYVYGDRFQECNTGNPFFIGIKFLLAGKLPFK